MINKVFILLSFLLYSLFAQGQFNINKFSPKIQFENLDNATWKLVSDNFPGSNSKGLLAFKHIPIIDSLNRPIEPMIAIIYESVEDSIDAIEYSISLLGPKPFNFKYELLGGYPDFSSDKNSVVFKGQYTREGIQHLVLIGYILSGDIGLEIICDATKLVYPTVESDMKKFLRSINVKD